MLFLATIIFLFGSVGMFSFDYWGRGSRSFQWATHCDAKVLPEQWVNAEFNNAWAVHIISLWAQETAINWIYHHADSSLTFGRPIWYCCLPLPGKKLNNLDLSEKFAILCSSTLSRVINKSPGTPLVWDAWLATLKAVYLSLCLGLCLTLSVALVYLTSALWAAIFYFFL